MLVVVWGEAYINRFMALSLPSLLASNNIPEFSKLIHLELTILTAAQDIPKFKNSKRFSILAEYSTINFVPIDDLIVAPYYGITLTLSYLRGVCQFKENMRDRWFLFLNSDLILANGSLVGLAKRILNGETAILANSIRSVSEKLEPILHSRINEESCVLEIQPRELVRLGMEYMHSTQIAKIVNNNLCHSVHVNQFYWQVDESTLVSRHYLMFMLCIRPERYVIEVSSFCDYSFIPEFCPTAERTAMDDSDDFFALELQGKDSERDFLRLGTHSLQEIGRSLSNWTTSEHRANASNHCLIFHSDAMPPNIREIISQSETYIKSLSKFLDAQPKPHRDHPYWVGTLDLYRKRQADLSEAGHQSLSGNNCDARRTANAQFGEKVGAREETSFTKNLRDKAYTYYLKQRINIKKRLLGVCPCYRMYHPDWIDYFAINALIKKNEDGRSLYIRESVGSMDQFDKWNAILDCAINNDTEFAIVAIDVYSLIVLEINRSQIYLTRRIIETLLPRICAGGTFAIFCRDVEYCSQSQELGQYFLNQIEDVAPTLVGSIQVRFQGGVKYRLLRKSVYDLYRKYRESRGIKRIFTAGLLFGGLALILLFNLNQRFRAASLPQTDRSSLLILAGR
jgi:hypothetical protein